MRIAIFMSGSGRDAARILGHQKALKNKHKMCYKVVAIFTDNCSIGNEAKRIGRRFGVPVIVNDMKEFFDSIGEDCNNISLRTMYYKKVLKVVENYNADCLALAGYMHILTEPILSAYKDRIISIHHADLSIRNKNGTAKYRGMSAVRDAILDGVKELRETTHIVVREVDQGDALVISRGVRVVMPRGVTARRLADPKNKVLLAKTVHAHEGKLDAAGNVLYPMTLEWFACGCFARDDAGVMSFDGRPIPHGLLMD